MFEAIPKARTSRRRFGVADAMILVAATAVGLAVARIILVFQLSRWPKLAPPSLPPITRIVLILSEVAASACPLLASLTVAAFILRLRRPRPSFRRLAKRPGVAACAAASASIACCLPTMLPVVLWNSSNAAFAEFLDGWIYSQSVWAAERIGHAVVGAWAVVAMAGRRTPPRSWIDRLCLLLGGSWIVALLVGLLRAWTWLLGW